MRRVSNAALPGVRAEFVAPHGDELIRENVFGPAGELIGAVVYVRRRLPVGSEYGWRPVGGRKLTDHVEAIRRLHGWEATP